MGVSTDGILAYGFSLGEDFDCTKVFGYENDGGPDFDALYLNKAGFRKKPDHSDFDKDWAEYWNAEKEFLADANCEVFTYCSHDYPIYFVAIKGSIYRVNRGHTTEIPDGLMADPAWKDTLRAYCELMGIEYQEPKWLLTSLWG